MTATIKLSKVKRGVSGKNLGTKPRSHLAGDPIRVVLGDLVNWSKDLPVWQQDALRRLYLKGKLANLDVADLSLICRRPHNLLEEGERPVIPEPLEFSHVPVRIASFAPVTLKSVGHTQNVNALADGQTLNFAESGLTVVYGDNGSGKSGYGRVLKRACRARDQEEILPNVYSQAATGAASARIQYSVGGAAQGPIVWRDGSATPPDLSNISAFDAKCASVHVDRRNELAYTPFPLELLQSLADVCGNIGNILKTKKKTLENQLPAFRQRPVSRPRTKVHNLILTLSAATTPPEVKRLSQITEKEQARLGELKRGLASDPATQLRRCRALKRRLEILTAAVKSTARILSQATCDDLRRTLKTAQEKAAAAKFAATEAFRKEPLPQVGSDVWKELWEAARKFSNEEAYPSVPFPNTIAGAVCVLCQQSLSPQAANRLATFETFVQQSAQKAADLARREVERFKQGIREAAASKETLREAVALLRDELDRDEVCRLTVRYLSNGRVRARRLVSATGPALLSLKEVPNAVSAKLEEVLNAAARRIAELEKVSNSEQRRLQEQELHELEDRAWLATIFNDVEAEIGRLKKLAAFDAAIRDTDTNRITRKTTEISRLLITDTMRDAFAAEVAALGISDRRIELVQDQSGYGSAKFRVSLIRNPGAPVGSVLSEGEHRCVALAAFLAELSTAQSRSGIVFEDPVSSLDHNYREAVAVRLVREAASRQVIVFTHDIAFLMLLDEESRKAGVVPHYQTVYRSPDSAGICASGTPVKAQPVPELLDRIEKRLNSSKSFFAAGQIDDWWEQVKLMTGRLRDAWEIAAERVVSPVLSRFSNKVHTGGLRKLTVLTDQDCADLKEGYAFCCDYCHTDPTAVNRPPPPPNKIWDEIERLRLWVDGVRKRQDAKK